MTGAMRTTITLLILLALLVGGALWGLAQVTKPFPKAVDLPACSDTEISRGTKVFADQVVVNVLNAGTRSGLARRTMGLLTDRKFVEGTSGNADRDVKVDVVEVWAPDRKDPGARLVASWFGTKPMTKDDLEPGVTVVVGDGFRSLDQGRKSVRAREDMTVCAPPGSF